jgi:hypothetical protein
VVQVHLGPPLQFLVSSTFAAAEVRRLEGLGATRYDHQQERGYDFRVRRDPWHNEFCVLQINFPDLLAQRPRWLDLGAAETGS